MRLGRLVASSIAWFVLGTALLSCSGSKEYVIVGTARAPGADGTVVVEETEGGNQLVTLVLRHLPPPERLGEGLQLYVVWFIPEGGQPIKAGKLAYDPDKREGRLVATSPESSFVLRVTAEQDPAVAEPGEQVVAEQQIGG